MPVEIEYIGAGRREIIQDGGNVDQIEVIVALQDLPVGSTHNLQQYLQNLPPDGRYGVTGYVLPWPDNFTIEPAQMITNSPHELVRVHYDDMRKFRPKGIAVRARRYSATTPNQPTPFEDAIIRAI